MGANVKTTWAACGPPEVTRGKSAASHRRAKGKKSSAHSPAGPVGVTRRATWLLPQISDGCRYPVSARARPRCTPVRPRGLRLAVMSHGAPCGTGRAGGQARPRHGKTTNSAGEFPAAAQRSKIGRQGSGGRALPDSNSDPGFDPERSVILALLVCLPSPGCIPGLTDSCPCHTLRAPAAPRL